MKWWPTWINGWMPSNQSWNRCIKPEVYRRSMPLQTKQLMQHETTKSLPAKGVFAEEEQKEVPYRGMWKL